MYAALLRLPGTMTHAQKAERVDTVLEALGLVKSKDTIIGEGNTATVIVRSGCTDDWCADRQLSTTALDNS